LAFVDHNRIRAKLSRFFLQRFNCRFQRQNLIFAGVVVRNYANDFILILNSTCSTTHFSYHFGVDEPGLANIHLFPTIPISATMQS